MTKHTKGPWSISELNAPAGYVSIDGDGHKALALVVWQIDGDKCLGVNSPACEANARLIKSAPKLLAALERCVESMRACGYSESNAALIQAGEAIAEAKGKL